MEEQVIINKNYRANSFEVGRAGSRWKIYFEDADDLKSQINKLKELGFNVEE